MTTQAHREPDALDIWFARQRRAWWKKWRWGLVAMLVLAWLPDLISLIHELWTMALAGEQGFLGLSRSVYASRGADLLALHKLRGALLYVSPLIWRVCAILAATGLAISFRLPGELVLSSTPGLVFKRYRAAVRHAAYSGVLVFLFWPAMVGVLIYFGDLPLTLGHLSMMVIPALTWVAVALGLSELQQFVVLRYPGRPLWWNYAVILAGAELIRVAAFYLGQTLGRGFMKGIGWSPLLTHAVIIAGFLIAAGWWWWLARRPSAAFLERCAACEPGTQPGFPELPGHLRRRLDPRTAARNRLLGLAAALSIVAWLVAWSSIQIVNSGVLEQPSLVDAGVPVISTRGHFVSGRLVAGHDKFDYSLSDSFPGFATGSDAPSDLVVVVHGFNNPPGKANHMFYQANGSFAMNSFAGEVVGFSWDADTQLDPFSVTGYTTGNFHAVGNGPKLAKFVADCKQRNPETRVHLIGYSMGARLALETLWALDNYPQLAETDTKVDSVHLLGAAVDNEEVELGERYGTAIVRHAAAVVNYYSTVDKILGRFYPIKEADQALGKVDIEHGEFRPCNFFSLDVARELVPYDLDGNPRLGEIGEDHSACLGFVNRNGVLLDDGVIDRVVEMINMLESNS